MLLFQFPFRLRTIQLSYPLEGLSHSLNILDKISPAIWYFFYALKSIITNLEQLF